MSNSIPLFKNYYRGKKVFITGHTGFKGAWLAHWLNELGAEVTGFSVDVPTTPSFFEVTDLKSKLKHITGDIRNFESLKTALEKTAPQIIFHLAAQPLVRDSYDDPLYTFSTNVQGTAHVLECARFLPSLQSVLIITTDKVYENKEWFYGYRENDRLGGKDPYSASKACAELVFHSYYESFFKNHSSVRVLSLRAGNVIGGGDWAKDRIIPDAFRALSQNKKLTIRNPQATRPWQHVLEPLSSYLWSAYQLSVNEKLNGHSFNFGPDSEMNITVEAVLQGLQKTVPSLEWVIDTNNEMTEKKESHLLKLNCDKAQSYLHIRPILSWKDTIAMTAEWYKEFYKNPQENMSLFSSQQLSYFTQLALENKAPWVE